MVAARLIRPELIIRSASVVRDPTPLKSISPPPVDSTLVFNATVSKPSMTISPCPRTIVSAVIDNWPLSVNSVCAAICPDEFSNVIRPASIRLEVDPAVFILPSQPESMRSWPSTRRTKSSTRVNPLPLLSSMISRPANASIFCWVRYSPSPMKSEKVSGISQIFSAARVR